MQTWAIQPVETHGETGEACTLHSSLQLNPRAEDLLPHTGCLWVPGGVGWRGLLVFKISLFLLSAPTFSHQFSALATIFTLPEKYCATWNTKPLRCQSGTPCASTSRTFLRRMPPIVTTRSPHYKVARWEAKYYPSFSHVLICWNPGLIYGLLPFFSQRKNAYKEIHIGKPLLGSKSWQTQAGIPRNKLLQDCLNTLFPTLSQHLYIGFHTHPRVLSCKDRQIREWFSCFLSLSW